MPKLKVNRSIVTASDEKVFCHEDYTQDLYRLYTGQKHTIPKGGKDIQKDQLLKITGISSITDNEVYFEVNNMTSVPIDLNKEKKFFEYNDLTKQTFASWLKTKEGKREFLDANHMLYIENSFPNLRGSLLGGYQQKLCQEFHEQIKDPKTAYNAKIISKNQGGFIVDVLGVNAFLPGGLAAANKILDFDKYIGKTVIVMVEDYLSDIDTFIMSNKKYVQYILPNLANEFDTSVKHTGIVTGCSKYGVFLEFDEVFTGLLHTSKMTPDTKNRFELNKYKAGDTVECWVREISRDYRLILTDFAPGTEEDLLQEGTEYDARVTAIKEFGIFVKLKTGESGLVPSSTIKSNTEYIYGSDNKVRLTQIKGEKFYFEFV